MSTESEWIDALARRFGGPARGLRVGIGSDCAVLEPADVPAVVSTDTQAQGVHFDPALMGWTDVGYRAVACALSDLAAAGADPDRPILVFLSVAFPDDMDEPARLQLADGVGEALAANGAALAGGDTVRTPGPLTITASVAGYTDQPLTRAGARPGDAVFVAGTLGGAGAGLHLLQTGRATTGDESLIAAYRRPVALLKLGHRLARAGASACADVSDGLLLDLRRLAIQSGVDATVDLDRLPLHPALTTHPAFDADERLRLAAAFGDDYALVFTAPSDRGSAIEAAARGAAVPLARVGVCKPGNGAVRPTRGGTAYAPKAWGYEH